MCATIGPERPQHAIPNFWRAILAVWLCLWAATSCRLDKSLDSPYLPGTKDYAGDDWTHDGDGDGVADSVEKYAPGCGLSPVLCLRNARNLKDIPPGRLGLRAENLMLWRGDAPRAPELSWTPSEAAVRGYTLSSSDTDVISIREGRLFPKRAGESRIVVVSPGFPALTTEFLARVVEGGVRLDSIHASDLVLAQNADTLPVLSWYPPDATYKNYTLSIEPDSVAVADGAALRGLKPGRAKAVIIAADGLRRAEFTVSVVPAAGRIAVTSLRAHDMVLRVKDGPQSPGLYWQPEDAADQEYTLASRDSSIAVPFSGKVKPLAPGRTVFIATSHDGGFAAEFLVTVKNDPDPDPNPDPNPDPDSITGVSVAPVSLQVGESKAPIITWTPRGAAAPAYTLASEDTVLATVALSDSGPRIVGRNAGATQVVLRAAGGLSSIFLVTITSPAIALVSIQAPDFSLDLRDAPYDPVISFTPSDAGDKSYILIAPETGGAIRIEANKVVPVRAGKSPLRIVPNGNPSAAVVCSATVTAYVRSVAAKNDTLVPGGELKSAAERLTWDPPEASDKSFRLVSKDTGIVRIGPAGTSYQGVAPGSARVILQALDGSGAADTFTVLVRIPMSRIIAKDLTLPNTDSIVNPWFVLSFEPDNASNKGWSFLYADSTALPPPSSVVAIEENWKLRAVGLGKASLIVYSLDNKAIRDTFTVTVKQPVTALRVDSSVSLNLRVGDPDVRPQITVLPADATVRTWHLVSADPAIASVVDGTSIHAVKAGSATLKAVSDDNPLISTTLEVKVRAAR